VRDTSLRRRVRAAAATLFALSILTGAGCGDRDSTLTGPSPEEPGPSNPGTGGSWPGPKPKGRIMYAVDLSNNFLVFGSESMNVLTAKMKIDGLPIFKRIIGIAVRPSNGKLYGIGTDSRVYIIDPLTAKAVPVSSQPFSPKIIDMFDTHFAMALEPETERVRLIAVESGANWSISLDDGTAISDPKAVYAPGTPLAGKTPRLLGLVYPTLPDSAKGPGWCSNLAYGIDADEAIMIASCDPAEGKWWPTGPAPDSAAPAPAAGTAARARSGSAFANASTKAFEELKDQIARCGEFLRNPPGISPPSEAPGHPRPKDDRFFPHPPPTEFYIFLVELGSAMNRPGVVKPFDTDPFMLGVTLKDEVVPTVEPIQSVEWAPADFVPPPGAWQNVPPPSQEPAWSASLNPASDPRAQCR